MSVMRIPILRKIFFDRYADRIAGSVLAIIGAGAVVFPRVIPFCYFGLTFMALTELLRTGNLHRLFRAPGYFWYMAGIFTMWCLITVFWSVVPLAAAGKVLFLTSTLIAAWIISIWLQTTSRLMAEHIKLGLLAGIVFAAFFMAIEAIYDQPIKNAFFGSFEFARPSGSKHIQIENGEVTNLPHHLLNRNIAVLNVLLWPAMWLVVCRWQSIWRWMVFASIAGIVALATFNSVHESSMIALIIGGLVFGLTYFAPRIGRISIVTGWILAILLVLPAVKTAYDAKLYKARWLPPTAHARIIFWAHTASEYSNNPIGGVGLRTTKVSDATRHDAVKPADHPIELRTGLHGHNIYLQTWYELGAIGAILLLFTGLALLARINTLAAGIKPYAFATFTVAATLAAFSWGMWQVWYIAMFAFAAIAVLIAADGNRKPGRDL